MRRIAYLFLGLAFVGASTWFCSSDAPAPTSTGGGGPAGASALQIRLFTSDANPVAGACTVIQAVVTLNGVNVPDGTGVAFSTDLPSSFFSQNGLPLISVVTQGGTTTTALCSTGAGLATVRANATVGSQSASATISIAFQLSPQVAPFFSFCSPSFGPSTGGTTLTINGGRFFGDATTTRATFNAAGVTREALVTGVTATAVTVVTPAFPEATSPSVPVSITLTFGTKSATPVTLSVPNCFAFGTATAGTPTITAVLPASGSNEGNTRVTIIGSGFVAPLQVFFGPVEAQVLSVAFNQIIVLTPPASGAGLPNLNATVTVRVHEVNSGLDASLSNGFRFVTAIQITAMDNTRQRVDQPFTPVTIHGQGFLAPVAVTLAGIPATPISVSATELLVLPGTPFISACTDLSGPAIVTNIASGDTATGPDFLYEVVQTKPIISSVSPSSGPPGTIVTITGSNLGNITSVTFGDRSAPILSVSPTQVVVTAPAPSSTAPVCPAAGTTVSVTVTSAVTTCTATSTGAFQYPCVFPTATPIATPLPSATPLATATPVPTNTPAPTLTPTPIPTVGGIADLALSKNGSPGTVVSCPDDQPVPGCFVTYQLAVTNNGPNTSSGVVLTDHLPRGTSFKSCSVSQGNCLGPAFNTHGPVDVNISFGTISAGNLALATIVVTANGDATSFTNFASVTASTFDPNPMNNTASAFTTVSPPSADLSITKTGSPNVVFTGGTLTYTILLTNNGPSPAINAIVSDPLPQGTTFSSCDTTLGSCGFGPGGEVRVAVGDMPVSSSALIHIVVTVTAPGGTTITNTAACASDTPDPNLANNTSSVTTIISP